jgi:hypothetical protein
VASCPRPSPPPSPARRLLAALPAALLTAAVLLAPATPAEAASGTSSLELTSQTTWVRGSTMVLGLRVASPLPLSRLALKVVLYPQLPNRTAFQESLEGTPSTLPLAAPPPVPLAELAARGRRTANVLLHLRVVTGSTPPAAAGRTPVLGLECTTRCDGVYPLRVVLLDRAAPDPLASPLAAFTTHLVYVADEGGRPLEVAIVLPVGLRPLLDATGAPTLGPTATASIEHLAQVVAANPSTPATLEVYPQALLALSRTRTAVARRALAALQRLLTGGSPNLEVLGTPFAPVGLASLAAAGLGAQWADQLRRGEQVDAALLGTRPAPSPYVSYTALDAAALALLDHSGVHDLVVPASNLAAQWGPQTPTAPVALASGSTPPASTDAFGADPELASYFSRAGDDPVLEAHRFLAELAQIYFDEPAAAQGRAVVVTPTTWGGSTAFLNTILHALAPGTPGATVSAVTLADAFNDVLPGANGGPLSATLAAARAGPPGATRAAVARARAEAAIVASVLADRRELPLRQDLSDAIYLAESAGISAPERRRYLSAPAEAFDELRSWVSIAGGARTVTLTAPSAKVPLTLVADLPRSVPSLHALLEVRSSRLAFPDGFARTVVLRPKDNGFSFRVTARTSGVFPLDVVVLTPLGHAILLKTTFNVRSTAISGAVIALSLGALLVLAAWWWRSVLRHRRRSAVGREPAPPA